MSIPSKPLYSTQVVPASAAAKIAATGGIRIMAVLLYPAAANSIVELKNAATDTGDVLLTVSAIANGHSEFVDLSELGGLYFSTACFCKPAGSGAIAYVWYTQAV